MGKAKILIIYFYFRNLFHTLSNVLIQIIYIMFTDRFIGTDIIKV